MTARVLIPNRRRFLTATATIGIGGVLAPERLFARNVRGRVYRQNADESGFYSNSYIIVGKNSCSLVDAHLNENDVSEIKSTLAALNKPLDAIIVTHPHPDHFMGLEFLLPQHPGVPIYSSRGCIDVLRDAIDQWPEIRNPLEVVDRITYSFAGREFEAYSMQAAESVGPLILYEPATKTLISGDMVLNRQHHWLAEGRAAAWIENLEEIRRRFEISCILPGHGLPGSEKLLKQTEDYIRTFVAACEVNESAQQVEAVMKRKFRDHVFPMALNLSAQACLS